MHLGGTSRRLLLVNTDVVLSHDYGRRKGAMQPVPKVAVAAAVRRAVAPATAGRRRVSAANTRLNFKPKE